MQRVLLLLIHAFCSNPIILRSNILSKMHKLLKLLILFSLSIIFTEIKAFQNTEITNYTIDVRLDTKNKSLTGKEIISWVNTSNVPVKSVQLHLYMNAFKDKNSTFMKEMEQERRNSRFKKTDSTSGSIYISSVFSEEGENLYQNLKFIQTDDNNTNDHTVVEIQLNKVVLPGGNLKLEIGFKTKLPRIIARTGYGKNDFYLIGQWFPKIGVFEKNRNGDYSWNCHQFHAHTEFYADFGTYKVSITLPENLIVGATGSKSFEIKLKDGLKMLTYEANNVHDFAWTASPVYKIFTQNHNGINLIAMMQPEHSGQNKRYFEAVVKAIDYFESTLGKYPYKTLTMVDPPATSSDAAGMEYPTFITCGSYFGIGKWARIAELVTIHEFGHQYFQGMLASNEFEQSFLDEGFNQYMESRIMDENYGSGSQLNIFGFKVNDTGTNRESYVSMDFPEVTEINTSAWLYPKGTYNIMTYTKTATALVTFENLIGRVKMDKILKEYFRKWKFRHPHFQDFVDVVNEELAPENYSWYFDQAFNKSLSVDYKVDTVVNSGKSNYVVLKKEGEFVYPVEVEVILNDGSIILDKWNGESKSWKNNYKTSIKSVRIDPESKNLMDLNLINNSYTQEGKDDIIDKYTSKWVFWIENLLLTFLTFIG